jgi:hypothetical protein
MKNSAVIVVTPRPIGFAIVEESLVVEIVREEEESIQTGTSLSWRCLVEMTRYKTI